MNNQNIYQLHAEVCKTLSNAKRLQIIERLGRGKVSASELIESLKLNKVNLSQSMAVLIKQGVVVAEKNGKSVSYQLADKRIIEACRLMREVLINRLKKQNKLLKEI